MARWIRWVTSSWNIGTDWSPIVIDCRLFQWYRLSHNRPRGECCRCIGQALGTIGPGCPTPSHGLYSPPMQYNSRLWAVSVSDVRLFSHYLIDQANNSFSTVQARGICLWRDQALLTCWTRQTPTQYCSSVEGYLLWWDWANNPCSTIQAWVGHLSLIRPGSSITSLDQQSLSQAWIERGNKPL